MKPTIWIHLGLSKRMFLGDVMEISWDDSGISVTLLWGWMWDIHGDSNKDILERERDINVMGIAGIAGIAYSEVSYNMGSISY